MCRSCFEGKMKGGTYRRKKHKYEKGEAINTDIMGRLNIPRMLRKFKKYFMSFIDTNSRNEYIKTLTQRSKTA